MDRRGFLRFLAVLAGAPLARVAPPLPLPAMRIPTDLFVHRVAAEDAFTGYARFASEFAVHHPAGSAHLYDATRYVLGGATRERD